MEKATRQVAALVRDGLSAAGQPAFQVLSIYVVILAINNFLAGGEQEDMPQARETFLAVCRQRLAALTREMAG